jgi:hypothetical protein
MYCAACSGRKLVIRRYGSPSSLRRVLLELKEFGNRAGFEVSIARSIIVAEASLLFENAMRRFRVRSSVAESARSLKIRLSSEN